MTLEENIEDDNFLRAFDKIRVTLGTAQAFRTLLDSGIVVLLASTVVISDYASPHSLLKP